MVDLNRRSYLAAAVGAVASVGGLFTVTEAAGQAGPPVGTPTGGRAIGQQEQSPRNGRGGVNQCVPPNILLAKFNWDERTSEFVFEEGQDEDAISITNVQYKDDEQEPVGLTWESDRPVCNVNLKAGTGVYQFTGNTNSETIDISTRQSEPVKAISNVVFCVRPAQAIICEGDMDMSEPYYDAFTRLSGDPASDGSREGVVHATSKGEPTGDYIHGIIDVRTRHGRVELSEVQNLSFDYFEGPLNERAAPDEIFIVVGEETDDGLLRQGAGGVFTAVKHLDAGTEQEQWHSLDLGQELTGGRGAWRGIDITGLGLQSSSATPSEIVVNTAKTLRDEGSAFKNAVTEYGGDAVLLAVGFGAGNTRNQVIGDRYYDNLHISSPVGSETFDWPAIVRLDLSDESTSGGVFSVTLTTQTAEEGFDFDNVSKDSLKLNALRSIVPPAERGVTASSVSVAAGGDELQVEFPASEVESLLQDEQNTVIVSGDLSVDRVISFFGAGTFQ